MLIIGHVLIIGSVDNRIGSIGDDNDYLGACARANQYGVMIIGHVYDRVR